MRIAFELCVLDPHRLRLEITLITALPLDGEEGNMRSVTWGRIQVRGSGG